VIAEAVRRSPLAGYAERFAALSEAAGGELSIRELPFARQLNLRLHPQDTDAFQRIADALRFALPVTPNTVASKGDRRALWLGPDEWLVVGPDGEQPALERGLRDALGEAYSAVTDVSANRTLLEIRGANARELLAHAIGIDLDPRSFGPGRCSQTLFAKAQVILESGGELAFVLHVRSSFAGYVADFLLDAAAAKTDR
jgi:sarcosine oxidase subunit gamma